MVVRIAFFFVASIRQVYLSEAGDCRFLGLWFPDDSFCGFEIVGAEVS